MAYLRTMEAHDVEAAVRIHLQGFPSFFLTFLGPRFLREFYLWSLTDPVGMALVVCDHAGQVVGVVVGCVDPRGYFTRLLRRRWWAFCLASLGAVVRHPSCTPRLARAVLYRGAAPSGPLRALLSSIVVQPVAQASGVGKLLLRGWISEAKRRGASGAYLTTDAEGNEAVNAFYQRAGWRLESSYVTKEGRRMNRYVLDW